MAKQIKSMARKVRPSYFGLGFLCAWIYCLWFTSSVFSSQSIATREDLSWLLSIILSASFIILLLFLLRRVSLLRHRWIPCLSAFGTSFGTVLFVAARVFSNQQDFLILAGAVLTGMFSSGLFVLWGEYFSSSRAESINYIAPCSAFVIFASIALVSYLSAPLSSVFVIILPLLSGGFLLSPLESNSESNQKQLVQNKEGSDKFQSILFRICILTGVACCISAFSWATALLPDYAYIDQLLTMGALLGSLGLLVVSIAAVVFSQRINIAIIYRCIFVIIITCLLFLVTQIPLLHIIACMLSIALSITLEFFLIMYFSLLAKDLFSYPKETVGLSEATVQIGIFVGNLFAIVVASNVWLLDNLQIIYLALTAIMVFALTVVIDQQSAVASLFLLRKPHTTYEAIIEEYKLSNREGEIFTMLAQGRSVPYISDQLFLSKNTIETHKRHIYSKLGIHSKQELLDLLDSSS